MKGACTSGFAAGLAAFVLLSGPASGEENLGFAGRPDCTPTTAERPYVCDVGDPQPVSMRSFRNILAHNDAVRAVVARLGFPDWVELQRVSVEAPWASYEIRTYYRDLNHMYAFGRAFLLDLPQVALVRYQGPIPASKLASPALSSRPAGAEEEALRAEQAAARAEELAEHAEREAARTEAIADAGQRDFRQSLLKQ